MFDNVHNTVSVTNKYQNDSMNKLKIILLALALLCFIKISAKDYYATDFGAKSDVIAINTCSIQKAIDFISENGGGRLVFTSSATLLGSTNTFDCSEPRRVGRKSMTFAIDHENIPEIKAQQNPSEKERLAWWHEARFGMFITLGVYSMYGGVYNGHQQARGGAEWIMNRCKIPIAEYREKARQFNPVNYNPDTWVKMARDAGMKYIVITTKHHDGFTLFHSKASDWNVVDATLYRKDLLKPLAEACK